MYEVKVMLQGVSVCPSAMALITHTFEMCREGSGLAYLPAVQKVKAMLQGLDPLVSESQV